MPSGVEQAQSPAFAQGAASPPGADAAAAQAHPYMQYPLQYPPQQVDQQYGYTYPPPTAEGADEPAQKRRFQEKKEVLLVFMLSRY